MTESLIDLLSREGLNYEGDEAEDDDSIVDQVKATVVTKQVGCHEETEKRDGYSDGGFAASETREKSCGGEIKEGGNGHEIVGGRRRVLKKEEGAIIRANKARSIHMRRP